MVGGDGVVYLGVNIEFAAQPLFAAVHAEQCAILNAVLSGAAQLTALASSATPCGHCRQFCQEIHAVSRVRFVVDASLQIRSLGELLPLGFGPLDLGVADQALLSQPVLSIDESLPLSWQTAAGAAGLSSEQLTRLQQAAERWFCISYAPYTSSNSSVALLMDDGTTIVGGPYIESCAFNPSLTPLRAAYAAAVLRRLDFGAVRAAVLVEHADARISHRAETQTLLAVASPHATLAVLSVSKTGQRK